MTTHTGPTKSGLQSSDYVLESDTLVWWSTPILRRSCPGHEDVNPGLKALVAEKRASNAGPQKQ